MGKRAISSLKTPKSKLPLSPATLAGNTLYLSGIVATNERGEIVGQGDIRAQTRRVLENMKSLVEAAGGTMQDVAQTTVYITDLANYAGMNEVYQTYFPVDPPARRPAWSWRIRISSSRSGAPRSSAEPGEGRPVPPGGGRLLDASRPPGAEPDPRR